MSKGGATIWARKTIDSEIFKMKPAEWFKIWFFIVNKVNHADNGQFKRGEAFTTYGEISGETAVTKHQVQAFLKWAKKDRMLTTRKTTRGMYVKVLNYNIYQTLDNYQNHTADQVKTTQEPHRNHTIHKNDKNDKNDKNTYTHFEAFWKAYPNKTNKKKSKDLWVSKNLDSKLEKILDFIGKAKQTDRWQKGYVKAPDVFFRNETWDDDLSAYGRAQEVEVYKNKGSNTAELLKAKLENT